MFRTIVLFTTTLLTALSAGLLFAYACSVNPGLHALPDMAYLSAMQSINRVILNPPFFVCFMGPVVLLPLCTWLYRGDNAPRRFACLLAAALLYLGGVFGVTMFGNVPLNQALNVFDLSHALPATLAAQREAFEGPWNNWHLLRTVAAVAAAALSLAAVFTDKPNAS